MIDALRSYVALAGGLTEATAGKAREAASALIDQAIALSGKAADLGSADPKAAVDDLAADIVASAKENREALTQLVRAEVDRAVARLGFVREDELAALRRHVERLEAQVSGLGDAGATGTHRAHATSTPDETPDETPMADGTLGADVAAPFAAAAVAEAAAEAVTPSETESPRPVKTKTRIAD